LKWYIRVYIENTAAKIIKAYQAFNAVCPLSGVGRTTIGGEFHFRLCRNDLLKISRPEQSQKTRRGKQWGKQTEMRRMRKAAARDRGGLGA
jgi:hypothetical protein